MEKTNNPVTSILDEENVDPIILYTEEGKEVAFDQIAIIPEGEKLYTILKPQMEIKGIADDEALVFEVELNEADPEGSKIILVEDVDVMDKVFKVYNELFEQETKKRKESAAKKSATKTAAKTAPKACATKKTTKKTIK